MKKNIKKLIVILLLFVVSMFAGFMFAKFADKYFLDSINLSNSIVILAVIYISSFLNTVLHEMGHMVGGFVSGYEFVSIRFGKIMFIKENGKLCIKKYSIAGTGGQCLMSPPSLETVENQPFLLFHISGVLVNFLLCVIGALVTILVPKGIVSISFAAFALISFAIGLINIIPINIGNDGKNIMDISKSRRTRKLINTLMYLSAQNTKGVSIEDMPIETLGLEDIEPQNNLETNAVMIEISYNMVCGNFEKAEKICDKLLEYKKAIPLLENELKCVKLLCVAMRDGEGFESVCTKELRSYIKQGYKYMLSKITCKIVCDLHDKDYKSAEKAREDFNKMCENYPIKGEVVDERKILGYVLEKFSVKEI